MKKPLKLIKSFIMYKPTAEEGKKYWAGAMICIVVMFVIIYIDVKL